MASASNAAGPEKAGFPWIKVGVGFAGLAAILAAYYFLPVAEWIESFRGWIEGLGPVGWLVFVVVYAVAVTALVPGSFLTLAAGVAFGLWGFPLVLAGATLGATMAFLAGRHLARDRLETFMESRPKFKAVDAAIEEEGWKTVALLRLSPAIPFSLQNWIFGATSVGFAPYVLASFFGMMPGTLLYVWIGTLGGAAGGGGEGEGSTVKYVFLGVGILATLVVTVLVGRKAKQKLAEHGVDDAEDR